MFILCAEVLACKIREHKVIKGIQISGTGFKITQFAGDTSLLLEGDKNSYEIFNRTLHGFGKKVRIANMTTPLMIG